MEHSPKFEMIKAQYQLYLDTEGRKGWSKNMVRNAVLKGWITEEEYQEIVGEDYE